MMLLLIKTFFDMDPSCLTTSQYVNFTSTGENVELGDENDEFTLRGKLDTKEIMYRNMVALQPISVSMTNLFYNVTADNNTLIVAEKQPISASNGPGNMANAWTAHGYTIRILEFPVGHYTGVSIARTLNDLLGYTYIPPGLSSTTQIFQYSSTTGRLYLDKYKFGTLDMSTQITFSFVYYLPANDGQRSWVSTIWDTLGLDSITMDENIRKILATNAPITENPASFNFFTHTSPSFTKTKVVWPEPKLTLIPFETYYGGKGTTNPSLLTITYPTLLENTSYFKLTVTDISANLGTKIENIRVGDYFQITDAELWSASTGLVRTCSEAIGYKWKIVAYDDYEYKLSVALPTTRTIQFVLHPTDTPFYTPVAPNFVVLKKFDIYRGQIEFPVKFESFSNYIVDDEVTAATKIYAPQTVDLIGPECVFISISGVHANHLCISNVATKVGVKRKSIDPGTMDERLRKDDVHKWLSIPVNSAYGEVIHRTFDDTWANSLQFFNRVPIDQMWEIKLYDHQMNLLRLTPNQTLTLCFKKFDSVL
jgi:hypothetical protein